MSFSFLSEIKGKKFPMKLNLYEIFSQHRKIRKSHFCSEWTFPHKVEESFLVSNEKFWLTKWKSTVTFLPMSGKISQFNWIWFVNQIRNESQNLASRRHVWLKEETDVSFLLYTLISQQHWSLLSSVFI